MVKTPLPLAALLAIGALAACSTSTPAEPRSTTTAAPSSSAGAVPRGDGTQVVYLVSMGFQHRYWQAVREGAEQAGKEFGYRIEFVGPENEQAVTQQLNMLRTAFTTRPAAIGLAALDGEASLPLLKEIHAAGIPIICFDSGVPSDIPATTVQTDNVGAAEEAAKHMIELTGGKGKVGLVCHDQTSQVGKERCEGFKDYVTSNAPGIELIQEQYANEVGLAANTAKAIIQANPDVVGIYGSNEAAAAGVVQGKDEAGRDDLIVIGFDSGKTQIDAIRSGAEAGAVTQAPVRMGYETVVAAAKAIAGEKLPPLIDSGFAWYDKTNIDNPKIAQNLYE